MNKTLPRYLTLLLFVALANRAVTQNPDLENLVQSKVDEVYEQGQYPGLVYGLAIGDQVYTFVAGYDDPENNKAITKDAVLPGGSVGKTFVSAIVMQLISENKLELDTKISTWFGQEKWFDELPNHNEITLRHLLQHSSGIQRYEFKDAFVQDLKKDPDRVWKPEELITYVLGDTALFEAGQGFSYADTNYILVGMIIEKITGNSYYDELENRILKPFHLSGIYPTNTRKIPGLVMGFTGENDPLGFDRRTLKDGVSVNNMQFEWTGGGLAFKTGALAKWGKMLYEGKIFDPALMEIYEDGIEAKEVGGKYGLGVQIMDLPIGRIYGHGGFFPGYYTMMFYVPEYKFAVAMQCNTTDFSKLRSFFRDLLKITGVVIDNVSKN